MTLYIDARVPVVFGVMADRRGDDALVLDTETPAPAGALAVRIGAVANAEHAVDCVCCVPRSAVGAALSGLFLARGRGEVAFFRRVLVVTQNEAAIRTAIEDDILASGWFRVS